MHQFEWLSERGGNFFNLLQKEGDSLGKGYGSNPGGNYGYVANGLIIFGSRYPRMDQVKFVEESLLKI